MNRSRAIHQPVRTCVGCRQRDLKANLLRVVVARGAAVPDPGQCLPGRGAYIHPRNECAQRAIPAGIARALRTEVRANAADTLRLAADRARNRPEVALTKGKS